MFISIGFIGFKTLTGNDNTICCVSYLRIKSLNSKKTIYTINSQVHYIFKGTYILRDRNFLLPVNHLLLDCSCSHSSLLTRERKPFHISSVNKIYNKENKVRDNTTNIDFCVNLSITFFNAVTEQRN